MNRIVKIIAFIGIISMLALAAACGGAGTATGGDMKTIMEKKVNDDLTVRLSNPEGKLKNGEQEIVLTFMDGNGNSIEIKSASLNFNMPAMGSMAEMNDPATLTTTDVPGRFKGKVKLQMAGEWIAQIAFEGKEKGKTTMTMTAY